MEYRTLEINVVSGKDLNKVNLITKMDVYVVVSITGADDDRSNQKTKTHVDHDGDNNPTWNFPIKFTIDDNADVHRLHLVFKLRCQRALGDKDIGQVDVPIKELLESSNSSTTTGSKQFVSYQIRKPSGKPKGQLTFSYQFSDKITGNNVDSKVEHLVTAYPAVNQTPVVVGSTSVYPPPPPPQCPSGLYPPPPSYACGGSGPTPPPPVGYPPPSAAGYPPQPVGYSPPSAAGYPPQPAAGGYEYGYGYPPATAYPPPPQYGYPPQQGGHGFGYPPVQRPPKKNSNLGLGLGAGLLGGALGGMIIGDAISDAGGYDGGFGDVGGFDF